MVHWTMLSSNFIGPDQEFLNEIVQLQKKKKNSPF